MLDFTHLLVLFLLIMRIYHVYMYMFYLIYIRSVPLESFLVPLRIVEIASGLSFMHNMDLKIDPELCLDDKYQLGQMQEQNHVMLSPQTFLPRPEIIDSISPLLNVVDIENPISLRPLCRRVPCVLPPPFIYKPPHGSIDKNI